MKYLFRNLLVVLFLGSVGIAMADDHRDDHVGARVIIVQKKHYHRHHYHHPKHRSGVSLQIGIGDHHDDHH